MYTYTLTYRVIKITPDGVCEANLDFISKNR